MFAFVPYIVFLRRPVKRKFNFVARLYSDAVNIPVCFAQFIVIHSIVNHDISVRTAHRKKQNLFTPLISLPVECRKVKFNIIACKKPVRYEFGVCIQI